MNALDRFDHSAWVTAGATLVSYGLILLVVFIALFIAPFLVYTSVVA